jgi:hypothetical protein
MPFEKTFQGSLSCLIRTDVYNAVSNAVWFPLRERVHKFIEEDIYNYGKSLTFGINFEGNSSIRDIIRIGVREKMIDKLYDYEFTK